MSDEPENPALVMLLRLEARLDGLTEELLAVKGRLAHVESVLARLTAESGSPDGPDARMQDAIERIWLDITEIAPPLRPGQDQDELAEVARKIKARRTDVYFLSDDEITALG